MKIMYLLPGGLFNAAGMERVTTIKANYLAEICNYDVSIVTTEQMGRPVFYPLSEKVHLYHLDIGISENYGKESYLQKIVTRFVKVREYRKKLGELLLKVRPDITVSTLGGWDIDFINDFKDGSIKTGELHFPGNYRELSARKLHKSFFPVLIGKVMTANFKRKCKKLKRLVVLTEEEKTFWDDTRNMVVIPNPLPFVAGKFSTTADKKAIAVGRLAYEKGFDMLIEAWKTVAEKHPDWELNIFGSGFGNNTQIDILRRLIVENRLEDQVKIYDPVKDIQNVYPNYSVSVLSSRYMEALPMVLLEAMACGVPLVAFDAPCGPKDVIREGKNGFLVKAGDIKTLADRINRLIESPGLRKTMGNTAREMSVNYRVEKIMARWNELFNELMNEKNSCIGN